MRVQENFQLSASRHQCLWFLYFLFKHIVYRLLDCGFSWLWCSHWAATLRVPDSFFASEYASTLEPFSVATGGHRDIATCNMLNVVLVRWRPCGFSSAALKALSGRWGRSWCLGRAIWTDLNVLARLYFLVGTTSNLWRKLVCLLAYSACRN